MNQNAACCLITTPIFLELKQDSVWFNIFWDYKDTFERFIFSHSFEISCHKEFKYVRYQRIIGQLLGGREFSFKLCAPILKTAVVIAIL